MNTQKSRSGGISRNGRDVPSTYSLRNPMHRYPESPFSGERGFEPRALNGRLVWGELVANPALVSIRSPNDGGVHQGT